MARLASKGAGSSRRSRSAKVRRWPYARVAQTALPGKGCGAGQRTDFARYRCDPDNEPPRVGFDFRVFAG